MRARLTPVFLVASVLLVACAEDDADSDTGTDAPVPKTDEELLELASNYWDDMNRITATAEHSDHTGEPWINVWISDTGESEFRALEPQVSDPDLTFPVGTFLLKEQDMENDGVVDSYTMMYKQPEGYNPDAGDWWWAVTDADFNVMMDLVGNGSEVTFCGECHSAPADYASSDFAIGIDSANQT